MMNIKEIYNKYKIYKIFLIPSLAAVISLAVLSLVIVPQVMEYFKQKEKIEELIVRIETLNNKVKELSSVDEEARKKNLTVSLAVLPVDRDVPQSVLVLQDLLNKSKLSLKNITYQPSSKTGVENSFTLTVTIAGSLSSIKDFMSELQNSARVFKVESAMISFQGENSFPEATIPLTIFYQPAPNTLITLDQPVQKITKSDEDLITNLLKSVSWSEAISATSSSIPRGKLDPFE